MNFEVVGVYQMYVCRSLISRFAVSELEVHLQFKTRPGLINIVSTTTVKITGEMATTVCLKKVAVNLRSFDKSFSDVSCVCV